MEKFVTPEEYNIDNLFNGKYNIPIYQRPYSWKENEVKQLLDDIKKSYTIFKNNSNPDNEDMLLFAGTIFLKSIRNVKNTYTEYDIVDGQQRITTITLMIIVLLNYFYKINSDDEIVTSIENYLWKKEDRRRKKRFKSFDPWQYR